MTGADRPSDAAPAVPPAVQPTQRHTLASRAALGAAAGTLFGLADAAVMLWARHHPTILAIHKVPPDVLWVAPMVYAPAFALGAVAVHLLDVLTRGRLPSPLLLFLLLAPGCVLVVASPDVLARWSAIVLGCGAAAFVARGARGRDVALALRLRRAVLALPLLVLALFGGVRAARNLAESRAFDALPPAPSSAPNVLVVVLDTVRGDRFDAHGLSSLTPRLNAWTAEGTAYGNAWSTTSWSLPSQASILTGTSPHEHGADWPGLHVADTLPTLAEHYRDRGYATGAFSGNASWVVPEYLGRGFLRFRTYILENVVRRTALGRALDPVLVALGQHAAGRGKKAGQVNAEFTQFLDEHRGRPFFAYLCYMDVNQALHHRRLNRTAWDPPLSEAEVVRAYDEGLAALDVEIGRLHDALAERGLLADTVVVLTSDHGESFGAHDTEDHDPLGHGTSLYPEQTEIPLAVIAPGRIAAGASDDVVASLRDVAATVVALSDGDPAPFTHPLPLTAAPRETDTTTALLTLRYGLREQNAAVRRRLLLIEDTAAEPVRHEQYELTTDPRAEHDLADGAAPDAGLLQFLREQLGPLRAPR